MFLQGRAALIKTKSLERRQCFKDLPRQSLAPACSAQTAILCFISLIRGKQDAWVQARRTDKTPELVHGSGGSMAVMTCLADEAQTIVEF